jgi:hypothetical protein
MKVGPPEIGDARPFRGSHSNHPQNADVTLEAALPPGKVDSSAIIQLRLNEIGC